jgi:hypothetical protein
MGKWLALSSAVLLGACGGDTGVQTVGNIAPPSGSTATPTPTHSFVDPTEVKTYEGIGAVEHFEYSTRSDASGQSGQLYAGDANTARDSGISITYNPRDAIFELTINRPLGLVSTTASRFQDPAHRTNFGGARTPQAGVAEFTSADIQYLQSGSSSGVAIANGTNYLIGTKGYTSTTQTFFYQKPGTTTTRYVTFAGYVRNQITTTEQQDDPTQPLYLKQAYSFDRAAFAFGERTANSAVPRTGTGSYTGAMIATAVLNPSLDNVTPDPTYFQWIEGTHKTDVNFATLAVASEFTGLVKAPTLDANTNGQFTIQTGWTFKAFSSATVDLINKGGFTGSFSSAYFVRPDLSRYNLFIAGSSIDGAFFGPNGEEIGGGFRIVGGTPDERIDILGTFTGKK